MGCCFAKSCGGGAARRQWRDRWPPPTEEPQEEERVKEVLMETPKQSAPFLETRAQLPSSFRLRDSKTTQSRCGESNGVTAMSDDTSELSESFSAADREKQHRREPEIYDIPRQISPARSRQKKSLSGEIRPRHQSPAESAGVVGRTMSSGEPGAARNRATVSSVRRDPGERSARRSLSPSAKRSGCGGGSAHCRSASAPRVSGDKTSPAKSGRKAAAADASKESLDNPLVSLECFIFL